ncbi:hypothetical protein [Coraliomargarita akajimensis]|uniref:PEP-CTERM protein-sorting domain-containing protein n=1 Tax=Coraliomargarita akajimensis (strain DSM 45221 / IAM 15411 / JCM 23193 / KCTC 12865 / 04OKA010-24) TaxID=583355 RepID=D5ERG3_CORAD|nr:hypothetical protein [Coraliomargarita akajimensis]ADE56007.1 hypothetical protein Caka_2994 [Coraliomargarita akajimensis DSM 45221]
MKICAQLLITLAATTSAEAYSISGFSQQSIDFDSFNGSGFSATPSSGQLDSNNWAISGMSDGDSTFGGTQSSGDFARGTAAGAVSTGGIYAFDITGNTALGFQAGGSDFTPGSITLRLTNHTGTAITGLQVEYTVYVYNDQNRSNSLNFSHSSTNSSYSNEAALDLISGELADGSPSWVETARSITLDSLTLANGDVFYLRWSTNDISGAGSRDQFALDDIRLTAVPEPSTVSIFLALASLAHTQRRRR